MILYQPVDFDLIPSNIFVPIILPGIFGYTGDCRYSAVRCEGELSNAFLEDIYAAYPIDPITWLTFITHPTTAANFSAELALGLFSLDEDCFLFDWVECQAYLGSRIDVHSFFENVRAGWLLPPARRDPASFHLNLNGSVDYQACLVGLLRMTLDQRLRLN